MSEYYDHYHRWEPLAEFHFNIDNEDEEFYEDNYLYCLCSRAYIRDGVRTYYSEKEYVSESDVEVPKEPHAQNPECEDQSHVHFSAGTSYKVKCEKDEGASCYCSASHTENYCSTDEHDPAQIHGNLSNALQPSDSGADLTYPDCQSDYTNHDKFEKMEQDTIITDDLKNNEDYLSEGTWDKFWAINGERIIWASWIKKYSDYINPDYLNETKDLPVDDNNLPKQKSADHIYNKLCENIQDNANDDDSVRVRKFSYDSKVNPYKKSLSQDTEEKPKTNELGCNKSDTFTPIGRKRSCSEHDRILSPRTLAGTDSMTNVTKITLSSHDVSSSHVTSESTPSDDYSVSSATSDDQNDQTRIANLDENIETPSEGMDTEQYWQYLWKKHFGELYALHYANYIESHDTQTAVFPTICIEVTENKIDLIKTPDIECENSEGNSQEMPSVIEVQNQVEELKIEDKMQQKPPKKKRNKNKGSSYKYLGSVGVLLQNLLKEEQNKSETSEVVEAGDQDHVKSEPPQETILVPTDVSVQQSESNSHFSPLSFNDGDDDPPEDKPLTLKRSHELDEDERAEKIKSTFEIMGFTLCRDKIPKGQMVYRKRNVGLRPPRYRKFMTSKKTYFDEDGNPYEDQNDNSQDEREMHTDDDCPQVQSDAEKIILNSNISGSTDTVDKKDEFAENQASTDNNNEDVVLEPCEVPLPADLDTSFSDAQENDNEFKLGEVTTATSTKRKRRQKRYKLDEQEYDISLMPPELVGVPKMIKYWKKRHSLFHRFDEGIKLDRESWFSVTPENVARHIATKCTYDVVLDAFCGAGGNTIQFAKTCEKVIAIDIDPLKIELARHNAQVYGVSDRIDFIVGDFFELAPGLKADMIFLSPPWGGPKYSESVEYDIENMLEPRPASELMRAAREINQNVALYLPRNTKTDQILELAIEAGGSVEIEQSYLDRRFVAITAYFY